MKRRKFLALTTSGLIFAAGGSLAHRVTRAPKTALIPWAQAGGSLYTEPRMKALSYAILAPNPHNRQPWLVDLQTPEQVTLFVDTNRMLPHTDPLNRQITVGLGCFLELMRMAAADDGYRVELSLFPEGESVAALDSRPVAVAIFVKDDSVAPDPLFAHVMNRRSLKEPYDLTREVSTSAISTINAAARNGSEVSGSNSAESVTALRQLTHDAFVLELETPHTYQESVDLFRIGYQAVDKNPDGIDFTGPMMETLHVTGQFSQELAADRTSSAYKQGIDAVLENPDTAMAHLWVVTQHNTRADQINAGRDWLRLNLACTAEGVAMQPLSQTLQEFPEMQKYYNRAHELLAPNGGTVQMLARLGYTASVPPSPRWPLDQKIISPPSLS